MHAVLIRMFHMGILLPIAAVTDAEWEAGLLTDYYWTLTAHGRGHSQIVPGCFGCKMRDAYRLGYEVLVE